MLVDTNIFIDYLRDHQPTIFFLDDLIRSKSKLCVSAVLKLELYAGKSSRSPAIQTRITNLLKRFRELPLDGTIAEQAGVFKRDFGLTAVDAIIATTAKQHNLTLVTRNVKHFQGIKSLEVLKPD